MEREGLGPLGSSRAHLPDQPFSVLSQLNLWRYGDFRADDADEFGYSR